MNPEPRAVSVGRPVVEVDEVGLAELGTEIKYRRDLLKMSLRELGRRVGVTASYLAVIEDGQSGKRRTKPDRELIHRLAEALGVQEVTKWLRFAGYPDVDNQWGSVESMFYQTELVHGDDPIKPGSRLRVERMEHHLSEVLQSSIPDNNRTVYLAEVPVFAYLNYLAQHHEEPDLRIVGVALRSGKRPGVFARLKDNDDLPRLTDVFALRGKAIATIGKLTESLIYLLASLDYANLPWQVRSIPKKAQLPDDEDGLVSVCQRSGFDKENGVRISITYNSGALVDDLRRRLVNFSLVPPSPFEVWKLESERWTKTDHIATLLGYDFIPGYPNYPSTLLIASEKDLQISDRKKYREFIFEEIAEIGRENLATLARWKAANNMESSRDEMFEVRDPKPDVSVQLSDTGFVINESALARDLYEMSEVAKSVLDDPTRSMFQNLSEDVITRSIVSHQELLNS